MITYEYDDDSETWSWSCECWMVEHGYAESDHAAVDAEQHLTDQHSYDD